MIDLSHPFLPTSFPPHFQVALTVVTLVFGELIPKSLGVSNAEMVARIMVPPINMLAVVLSPVGKVLSMFAKLVLRLLGAFIYLFIYLFYLFIYLFIFLFCGQWGSLSM